MMEEKGRRGQQRKRMKEIVARTRISHLVVLAKQISIHIRQNEAIYIYQ